MEISTSSKSQCNNSCFKNVLKQDNIRVFILRNKYFLVDSGDFAFMMFEFIPKEQQADISANLPTIKLVDFIFRHNIADFLDIKRVYFNEISRINIQYMCNAYLESKMGESRSNSFNERIEKIKERHHVSLKFARLLARLPKNVSIFEVCTDIREANFYLLHMDNWKFLLKNGTSEEKKAILQKLLPKKTYDAFQLNYISPSDFKILINEIFNISC